MNFQKLKSKFTNLKGDLFGGITAGVVALPLALAFGVQSGLGPEAGLYGAMVLGFFAALFGGTATQVSGPTGPMTVISALIIATAIDINGSIEEGIGFIIAIFILSGILQVVFGLVKIGKYIKYIPYPVLSGFMTGIGVIIILLQVYPFMGYDSPKSIPDIFLNINNPIADINWFSVLISIITISIIYLLPKITKIIPSTLVALLIVSGASFLFHLDIPVIGNIPEGIPKLKLDTILSINTVDYWTIAEFAAMLAALGALDSLLTSVIADNITKTKHNSNKELIGQGIGNILSSFIGGLPGAGATMRTVVNINAGGKTRLSGMIHGLLLFIILLGAGKYAAFVPKSVLAGILITVGIGIIDYKGLKHLRQVPLTDSLVLVIVLVITVFGNLLHAVGVGVVLACILFMKKSSDIAESGTSIKAIEGLNGENPWPDEENVNKLFKGKIFIKHLYGPMFFGFTSRFQEIIQELSPDIKVLIIRMGRVPYIDQSGVYALEDAILELHKKNVTVLITGIKQQPMDMLKKINVIPELIPTENLFETFTACNLWLKKNIGNGENGFTRFNKANPNIKVNKSI